MAKFCNKCSKRLSFRDSFVWDGKPICRACLQETDPTRTQKPPETIPPSESLGFNWGTFFLTPIWLMFHGKIGAGIGLILLNMYVNYNASRTGAVIVPLAIPLGIAVYFGTKGNKIAWKNKGHSSREQLKKQQKPWMIAGLAVWTVMFILLILHFAGVPYF